MSDTHLPFDLLNRFAVAPEFTPEHLLELKHGGGSWETVLDWDYTMAVSRSALEDLEHSDSSWEIVRKHMLPGSQEAHLAAYQKYRPLEKTNLLTPQNGRNLH